MVSIRIAKRRTKASKMRIPIGLTSGLTVGHAGWVKPCGLRVTVHEGDAKHGAQHTFMSVQTGGGGPRRPNRIEAEIFDLWDKLHLNNTRDFNRGERKLRSSNNSHICWGFEGPRDGAFFRRRTDVFFRGEKT